MSSTATPVTLPTLVWNPGGTRRALLVHGLSSVGGSWWRVAAAMADAGWHVVAPDLRGHGMAPRAVSYRLEDHAADVWALGSGWDLAVGHSLGGAVVTVAASLLGWADRVLLVDPVLKISADALEDFVATQLEEVGAGTTIEGLLEAHPTWHEEDAVYKVHGARHTSRYVVEHCARDSAPWDLTTMMSRLMVPTTILGADPEQGGFLSPDLGLELASTNARVEYRMIGGAGHSIHREQPDTVVEAILAGT